MSDQSYPDPKPDTDTKPTPSPDNSQPKGPASSIPSPEEIPPPSQVDVSHSQIKEYVTALIAVVIVGVTVWMLIATFNTAGEGNRDLTKIIVTEESIVDKPAGTGAPIKTIAYEERKKLYDLKQKERQERKSSQKDILLYALSLLGVILGYYFGRVPAERRAEQAEATAKQAQSTVTQAVNEANLAQQQAQKETGKKELAERKLVDVKTTLTKLKDSLEPNLGGYLETLEASKTGFQVPADQKLDAYVRPYIEVEALLKRLED